MHHMPIDVSPDIYLPSPPPREIVESYGIAVIGCGAIAQKAHMPAYQDFGYRVVATCDIVEEKAQQVANEYAIPIFTSSIDKILDLPEA